MQREPRRVLWIDDDPGSVEDACAQLEISNIQPVVAHDFNTAFQHLKSQRFDIVLIDSHLRDARNSYRPGGWVVEYLRAGKLGPLNAAAPFAFVIGFRDRFLPLWDWKGRDDFLGVLEKKADVVRAMEKMLASLLIAPGLVDSSGQSFAHGSHAQQQLEVRFKIISAAAWLELNKQPRLLRELDPRQFEELVAELFERDGFDVTLTPFGRDRGVDLYAARATGLGELRYVVQCKRYTRPIGPALVRELRGVVDREDASCGVLVTTSSFTPGANQEQHIFPSRISLQDLQDVAGWLRRDPIFTMPDRSISSR